MLLLYNLQEMQKREMLSEKALQIAEKRREAKVKGEKEHLNAEFQRTAVEIPKSSSVISANK